jgi:putative Ca2+/H+ antiporter (TMEM165/GDT1 family)
VVEAFLTALAVVFVAELGDKSQLLTLTFAARYRLRVVLAGLVVATAALMALSVATGTLVGAALPERPLQVVAGVVFLAFALWTLRDAGGDAHDHGSGPRGRRGSAVATVAGAFALSELGDKTMLAAVTLASTRPALATWAGATLGMVAANALALVVGDQLGARVPDHVVRVVAAGLFVVFGVLLLAGVG